MFVLHSPEPNMALTAIAGLSAGSPNRSIPDLPLLITTRCSIAPPARSSSASLRSGRLCKRSADGSRAPPGTAAGFFPVTSGFDDLSGTACALYLGRILLSIILHDIAPYSQGTSI